MKIIDEMVECETDNKMVDGETDDFDDKMVDYETDYKMVDCETEIIDLSSHLIYHHLKYRDVIYLVQALTKVKMMMVDCEMVDSEMINIPPLINHLPLFTIINLLTISSSYLSHHLIIYHHQPSHFI